MAHQLDADTFNMCCSRLIQYPLGDIGGDINDNQRLLHLIKIFDAANHFAVRHR
ncbi:hypothetical protein SDC9_206961 [bioreactor metagenome]|uniref:Uncharacterized protein n=1 Tax=bioreactor metagenome TaxID=1076179 RepID=A0A645J7X1_9ZZZZ